MAPLYVNIQILRSLLAIPSPMAVAAALPAPTVPLAPPAPICRTGHTIRHSIPAVWMRSGTSKGLFIHKGHLPSSPSLWGPIFVSMMGSHDGDKRQLDGLGGATSTTSKVAVVSKSCRPGIDVEYTFVQVVPDQARVDMTGNCGNMAAGVGPFALDEGLVHVPPGATEISISIHNTNTDQTLLATVQVGPDGRFQEEGDYQLPGVVGTSSPIKMAFLHPGGSMTGAIFPTGLSQEVISLGLEPSSIHGPTCEEVKASLVDAANPFVFVDGTTLPSTLYGNSSDYADDGTFLAIIESIRCEAAVRFGLATDSVSASMTRGTPKIAVLFPPEKSGVDIRVLSFSIGKPHPSLQLTGAVCLGAALSIPGTVAWELGRRREKEQPLGTRQRMPSGMLSWHIQHPAGQITAEISVDYSLKHEAVYVKQVAVYRTTRRLFEGRVFYRQ